MEATLSEPPIPGVLELAELEHLRLASLSAGTDDGGTGGGNVEAMFNQLDKDHNGVITRDEVTIQLSNAAICTLMVA